MTITTPGAAPDHTPRHRRATAPPFVRIRLQGELDITSRDATLYACTAIPGAAVVVDLSDVTFLDSAGSLAFLQARRHLERDGGTLLITGASGEPARLLTLLDEIDEQVLREMDTKF